MSAPRILYDHDGQRWPIDTAIATGGQGAVHPIVGNPEWLAKVYSQPPDGPTEQKLRLMLGHRQQELRQVAAWPVALLHDAPNGSLCGFLMPRLVGSLPIQRIYSLGQRRQHFPRADWAALIQAAAGCAAAFDAVHRLGYVVGDVSGENLFVSPGGKVLLIDCDSFQITANGRVYPCPVCTPDFTPPELQGQPMTGVRRTANHDHFGLAVLIYQLLFIGPHPFIGSWTDPQAPDHPKETIGRYRFVYARGARDVQPSLATPPFELVPLEMRELFEKAFQPGSEREGQRPTAAAWMAALGRLLGDLGECPRNRGHRVPRHLAECPWCRLLAERKYDCFPGVAAALEGAREFRLDQAKIARLGQDFARVSEPSPVTLPLPPTSQSLVPEPLTDEVLTSRYLTRLVGSIALLGSAGSLAGLLWLPLLFFGVIVGLIFGVWWRVLRSVSAYGKERQARAREVARWQQGVDTITGRCRELMDGYGSKWVRSRDELGHLLAKWQALPADYAGGRRALEQNREERARVQFAQSQFLSDAKIAKIGPARVQVLASFGIETAYDVNAEAILQIKGFGPRLTQSLVEWKGKVLASFRFDPRAGVPEADLCELALGYIQRQEGFANHSQGVVKALEILDSRTQQECRQLLRQLGQLLPVLAQAEANLGLITRF